MATDTVQMGDLPPSEPQSQGGGEMTLIEHLLELRSRVTWMAVAVVLGMAIDPQRMRLAPLGDRALRLLAEYDCRVVVVSNQSGVARGYFSESSLERVEDWLRTVFRRFGVDFAGFYYCPHHPEGDVAEFAIECDCRKPGDGMLRRAAADLGIDRSPRRAGTSAPGWPPRGPR